MLDTEPRLAGDDHTGIRAAGVLTQWGAAPACRRCPIAAQRAALPAFSAGARVR
jgi:hypothetical protein